MSSLDPTRRALGARELRRSRERADRRTARHEHAGPRVSPGVRAAVTASAALALTTLSAGPAAAGVTVTDAPAFAVQVTGGEDVSISCGKTSTVVLEIDGAFTAYSTECAKLLQLTITANGNFANTIDARGLDEVQFPEVHGEVTLVGGQGPDLMFASPGGDDIFSGPQSDTVNGGAGNDEVFAGQGDDTVRGGSGNDFLSWGAGQGSDLMIGGGDSKRDYLTVGTPNTDDRISISGTEAQQRVVVGLEELRVFSTEEMLFFVAGGDDRFTVGKLDLPSDFGTVQVEGGEGNDRISLAGLPSMLGSPVAQGGAGNDVITGSALDDSLYGGDGNDVVRGGVGELDLVEGGDDNDSVSGGPGIDLVFGDASVPSKLPPTGNDLLQWRAGDGTDSASEGGPGTDTMEISGGKGSESLRVVADVADKDVALYRNEMLRGKLEWDDMERLSVLGLGGDDTITLQGLDNLAGLTGARGDGGPGTDTLRAPDAGYGVTLSGGSGNDRLVGSDFVDLLMGKSGLDWLTGGQDNDIFAGGPGADGVIESIATKYTLFNSSLDDGAKYNDKLGSIERARFTGSGIDNVFDASAFSGRVTLIGGGGDDTLDGGKSHDRLEGRTGSDDLDGHQGDDTLFGGPGTDKLTGGRARTCSTSSLTSPAGDFESVKSPC